MKKYLSLVFTFIFALGICFSAPITINVNAATADELTFVLNSDKKSYSVSRYPESNMTDDGAEWVDVVIPSEYKGLPVTRIGSNAFKNCEAVKSIVIPDSITVIEAEAFNQCWYLSKVTMSKNITSVGAWCFNKTAFYDNAKNWENKVLYCGNVLVEAKENISGVYAIKSGTKCIADSAFRFREKLTSVTIPDTVTHIGNDAFYGCALSKVVIPEGVVSVGCAAFGGNQKLTTITFPKSIKNIDLEVLVNCENLKTVNYNGTKAEWSKIKIHEQNTHLLNAKLVCTGKKLVLSTPSVKIANTAKGIKVTWGAVANAESYIVYRSTYNTSTKKWSKWSAIKKGVTATSYTDTKVKLGTSYKYTVRAVNGSVMSSYKGTSGLKYNVTPTVKVANDLNGIKVSWSTAANATGYTVYSSTYNAKTKKWSGWKNRGTTKATTTSWVDKSVKSGTYYKYTVRACNGKSIKSSYKASANMLFLAQPTVKIANNASGIKVSWNKITGSKGYTVYRQELVNGAWSSWKNLGTIKNGSTVSWVDKSVKSGSTYRYTVRTVNGSYKSAYKASSGLLFLAQPTVKIANASNGVKVSWNEISGAIGYTIYSATYDAKTKKWSSWKNLGNVSTTAWIDEGVESGITYRYTVRATNGNCKSTYKASSSIIYLTEPDVQVSVDMESKAINIKWSESVGSTNYYVYRAEHNSEIQEWSAWTCIAKIDASNTNWCDKDINEFTNYKYTVRAVNTNSKSSFKNYITVSYPLVPGEPFYRIPGETICHKYEECAGKACESINLLTVTQESLSYCEKCFW